MRETSDMSGSFAFLPGASGQGSFWEPVAAGLGGENGRFFDWPGFGDVPADPAVASYDDLASLVIARLTGPTSRWVASLPSRWRRGGQIWSVILFSP